MEDHPKYEWDEDLPDRSLDGERDLSRIRPGKVGTVTARNLKRNLSSGIAGSDYQNVTSPKLIRASVLGRVQLGDV
jgi:hypothetical protein